MVSEARHGAARNNDPFLHPRFTQEVHYECELVVRASDRVGKCIDERFARRYYSEVGLGIDFTARDLQRAAIAAGAPWECAKAFDHSAASRRSSCRSNGWAATCSACASSWR